MPPYPEQLLKPKSERPEFGVHETLMNEFWARALAMEPDEGHYIQVDVDTMIHEIYTSPTSKPWFNDLVLSVVKKYGCNKTVLRSNLFDDPMG